MKQNRWNYGAFLFFLFTIPLIIQFGCKSKTTAPEQFTYPDSNLSFSQHIHPIFAQDCAFSPGCHQTISPAAGLDLETLFPTFQSNRRPEPVVISGQPNNSVLYLLLLNDYQGVTRMPKNGPPLPEAKIQAIRKWIEEGAIITN